MKCSDSISILPQSNRLGRSLVDPSVGPLPIVKFLHWVVRFVLALDNTILSGHSLMVLRVPQETYPSANACLIHVADCKL